MITKLRPGMAPPGAICHVPAVSIFPPEDRGMVQLARIWMKNAGAVGGVLSVTTTAWTPFGSIAPADCFAPGSSVQLARLVEVQRV